MSAVTIEPAHAVRGHLRVPGDKSISHRYAILAALADGPSRLTGYSTGADCHSTLSCLRQLGADIRNGGPDAFTIVGRGLRRLCSPSGPLDAGNSGTTMRILAGVLAAHPFTATLVGDRSLSRRPMGRVIEPLRQMGAEIESTDGHAPLTIRGAALHGIAYRPAVPSAQVKSAVLLAGLQADGTTSVTEPAATRDHTERALRTFGASVNSANGAITLTGGQALMARDLSIPGDFSSAAFWMIAAAALPGSRVEIEDVGLNPTRTALVGVLRRFGARIDVRVSDTVEDEPRGTVIVEGDRAGAIEIAPEEVAGLIDELPAIAALGARGGSVSVRGASELRVKESDRIAALVSGFRALGIGADERPDGFLIHGSGSPGGGVADAHDDHRIAMALTIAALAATGPSTIEGAEAVAISYPAFYDTLERLIR